MVRKKILVICIIGLFVLTGTVALSTGKVIPKEKPNNKDTIVILPESDYPVACFVWSPSTPTKNKLAIFDATCSYSNCLIEWYCWDFDGDGVDDGNGPIKKWRYSKEGTYTVKLWVKDALGKTDTLQQEITVKKGGGRSISYINMNHFGKFILNFPFLMRLLQRSIFN
jgi:PKD repeat protein